MGEMLNRCDFLTNFNKDYDSLSYPQTRIKIAGKNINNLRYADDTTLMAESE